MTLSTVDADGRPAARYVLLRGSTSAASASTPTTDSAKGRAAGRESPRRADLRLAADPPLGARRGRASSACPRPRATPTSPRARARRRSARGRRRRARSSPRATNSSARTPTSSGASPTPRSPPAALGRLSACAPSASSSGRAARAACTIACATSAPATAGASSSWPVGTATRRGWRGGRRGRRRGRRGDQRGRVGQARGLVQAVVLRELVGLRLHRVGRGVLARALAADWRARRCRRRGRRPARGPRGHRQRDDPALLDRDRLRQRELHAWCRRRA